MDRGGVVQLQKFVTMRGVRPDKIDMRQLKLVKELDARAAANKEQHTNRSRMKREAREEVQMQAKNNRAAEQARISSTTDNQLRRDSRPNSRNESPFQLKKVRVVKQL